MQSDNKIIMQSDRNTTMNISSTVISLIPSSFSFPEFPVATKKIFTKYPDIFIKFDYLEFILINQISLLTSNKYLSSDYGNSFAVNVVKCKQELDIYLVVK